MKILLAAFLGLVCFGCQSTVTVPFDAATDSRYVAVVDASPEALYTAMTTEEGARLWINEEGLTGCEIDARVGGEYRYTMSTPDFPNFVMYGTYLQLIPNKLVQTTENYEGFGMEDMIVTMHMTPKGDQTELEVIVRYVNEDVMILNKPHLDPEMPKVFTRLEAATR